MMTSLDPRSYNPLELALTLEASYQMTRRPRQRRQTWFAHNELRVMGDLARGGGHVRLAVQDAVATLSPVEWLDTTAMKIEYPEGVTDTRLEYLDGLRESGVTNMFGAGPYLEDRFTVTKAEGHKILAYWMKTFSERHPR